MPSTVKMEKPWGRFEQHTHNLPSTVIITVAPGGILSRQYHHKRDELWVVLDAGACVELDGKVLHPDPEEKLFIARQRVHRLSSTGSSPVRVLEISFGEFDEDDIVRLEDVYGRAGAQPYHRFTGPMIVALSTYGRVDRPAKGAKPRLSYRIEATLERAEAAIGEARRRAGRFIVATAPAFSSGTFAASR
jgi:mannose-6-phosphate isomerase